MNKYLIPLVTILASTVVQAETLTDLPPAVKQLETQGIEIIKPFSALVVFRVGRQISGDGADRIPYAG